MAGAGFSRPSTPPDTSGVYFRRSPPTPVDPEDLIIDADPDPDPVPRTPFSDLITPRPHVVANRSKAIGLGGILYGNTITATYNADWRYHIMHGDPINVFFKSTQHRFEELNGFNAKGISPQKLQDSIDLVSDPNLSFTQLKTFLDDPNNKALKEWLDEAMHLQFGRKTYDFLHAWQIRSERGRNASQDPWGELRKAEVLDILKAAKFYNGISLNIEGNSFKSVLSIPGEKPIPLFKGTIHGDQTSFQMLKVPAAHRDRGLVALADIIISHQQSNQSQQVTLTPGRPLDVMRLAELLLCKGNMKLDFSEVDKMVTEALTNTQSLVIPANDPKGALTRWNQIKALNATDPRDPAAIRAILNDNSCYDRTPLKPAATATNSGGGGPGHH